MLISLAWLNRMLDPGNLTGDEAERVLTAVGFPLESREKVGVGTGGTPAPPGGAGAGDERLDVEITSNRGDCLCHLGIAREIAAATGRRLVRPAADVTGGTPVPPGGQGSTGGTPVPLGERGGGGVAAVASVDNRVVDVCPRFTARVIRGVRVGPSPKWLVEALESVGQRAINNVVDASNFVLFELGNPTHTFDLSTLKEKRIVVRYARDGEKLTMLDDKSHALRADELVVADAERAVSLAGVMGGLETSVTGKTTDLLVEAATWDPATIRRAARRLQIRTDASHRFERVVHPGTIDFAMARLCGLILELAGGELVPGMIDAGRPVGERRRVTLRAERCSDLLGIVVPRGEMSRLLNAVEVTNEVDARSDALACTIPHHRAHDLTREVDLVEEVARLHGFDAIPIEEKLHVTVATPQESERAVREAAGVLAGLGFYETVTFSFVTREQAELYIPTSGGLATVHVDEERRKGAPYLRPSVVPSLLACRRLNQDAGVRPEGGVRLFELGSGYQQRAARGKGAAPETVEFRSLAMILDAPDAQQGLRQMRGVVEALCRTLGGAAAEVEVRPAPPACAGDRAEACAEILINGSLVGGLGVVSDAARKHFGLDEQIVDAEILLDALIGLYPPESVVTPLPAFPAIERDLSLVVDEGVEWARIARLVEGLKLDRLAGLAFVGVYRGKQAGAGKKSVTLRLRFQDPTRTLRHEEVDPQVEAVVAAAKRELGAELRG